MPISWAIGQGASILTSYHGSTSADRSQLTVNFVSGQAEHSTPLSSWKLLSYSFLYPIALATLVLTLFFRVAALRESTVGRWLMHSRSKSLPVPDGVWYNTLTCGLARQLQIFTAGELLVFATLLVMLGAFFVVAWRLYTAANHTLVHCLGYLTSILMSLALLPTARNSLWQQLFGLPWERAVKWHRLIASLALVAMITHGVTMVVSHSWARLFSFTSTSEGYGNVYGLMSAAAFIPLMLFALEPVRRRAFRLFYYAHQIFYLGVIAACLHSVTMLYLCAAPMTLHVIDRALRWRRTAAQPVRLRSAHVLPVGGGRRLVELRVSAPGFRYNAGDYVFLNIRSLSQLDWHPFTVSSAPEASALSNDEISFHILCGNDEHSFTGRLATWALHTAPNLLEPVKAILSTPTHTPGSTHTSSSSSSNSIQLQQHQQQGDGFDVDTEVRIEGPYGQLSVVGLDTEYSHLVLVCGGVGCTPMMSILGHLVDLHQRGRLAHVRQVHLIWTNLYIEPVRHW